VQTLPVDVGIGKVIKPVPVERVNEADVEFVREFGLVPHKRLSLKNELPSFAIFKT